MSILKIMNQYGSVRATVIMLPGCCGIALVYNVRFRVKGKNRKYIHEGNEYKKSLNTLHQAFDQMLKNDKEPFHLNRARVLMADRVGGEIDGFVNSVKGWKRGRTIYNPKSCNKTRTYECSRKVWKKMYNFTTTTEGWV